MKKVTNRPSPATPSPDGQGDRSIYLICAAAFCMDVALSAAFTAMPFFIFHQLGGDAGTSGAIAAAQSVTYGIGCLLSSPFVARTKDSIRWAVIGGTAFAILFPAATFAGSAPVFAVISVAGLGMIALYWPAVQSRVGAAPDPHVRRKHIAQFNISWALGLCLGPLIGGGLYTIHYRLPFFASCAFAMISVALVRALPREEPVHGDTAPDDATEKDRANAEAYLYCTWLANMTAWALLGAGRSVYPKLVDEVVGAGGLVLWSDATPLLTFTEAPARLFSYLAAAIALARACVFFTMGKTHRWHGRFDLLLVLQLAAAGAFWLLGNTNSLTVMLVSFVAVGVSGGAIYFVSLYYSTTDPVHKHRRAAIHEGCVGVGSAIGSMGFGLLAAQIGTAWPFTFTPVFIVASLILQTLLLSLGRRRMERRDAQSR